MPALFGTDGVRGEPGRPPLDARTLARLGAAVARALGNGRAALLAARDTRQSGSWIERELARGVAHQRGTLVSAGVLPTPAAALLVPAGGFDGALVVSASHNPCPDNGIKVLTARGEKASPATEAEIRSAGRRRLVDRGRRGAPAGRGAGPVGRLSRARGGRAGGLRAGRSVPHRHRLRQRCDVARRRPGCCGSWASTSSR